MKTAKLPTSAARNLVQYLQSIYKSSLVKIHLLQIFRTMFLLLKTMNNFIIRVEKIKVKMGHYGFIGSLSSSSSPLVDMATSS